MTKNTKLPAGTETLFGEKLAALNMLIEKKEKFMKPPSEVTEHYPTERNERPINEREHIQCFEQNKTNKILLVYQN